MSVAARPVISPARHADRLERAAAATQAHGLDALLVGVGPDLRYLTGYLAMPLERLTMLVVPRDDDAGPVIARRRDRRPSPRAWGGRSGRQWRGRDPDLR